MPAKPEDNWSSRVGRFQVGIIVRDLEALTPFYRDGLGLEEVVTVDYPDGRYRFFNVGVGGAVKLKQPVELPSAANPPGGIAAASGMRWFSTDVADLDEVISRCEAAGGRVTHPPLDLSSGSRMAMLEDPEGNCQIEIVQRGR